MNLFPSRRTGFDDRIYVRRKLSDMIQPRVPLWRDLRGLVLVLEGNQKKERV